MTREELNVIRGYVSNIQAIKDAHNTNKLPINYGTICTIIANGWKLIEELKTLQQEPVIDVSGVPHKIAEFFSNWDGDESAIMEISVDDMREIAFVYAKKARIERQLKEKALEQQSVLDKIKNEFIDRYPHNYANELELGGRSCVFSLNKILQIIDKYRVEFEPQEKEVKE